MRYSDHHQEELTKRRLERANRERQSRPEGSSPSSPEPKPPDKWNLWDYLVARDAPKPGFWPWMCANEPRFTLCIIGIGIFCLTIVLTIVRFLSLVGAVQIALSSVNFLILIDILLVILILLLIPISVAYFISGKRKPR